MDQFQKEQNDLLKFAIDNMYFKKFKELRRKVEAGQAITYSGIELYITPICNQRCSYCYLVKHGDELYPKEIRDIETILNNMRIFFDYLIETGNEYIPRLDLFSGEIWGMELGTKVLNIVLDYLDKGIRITDIMIPTNASFITDDTIAGIMDYFHKEFAKRGTTFRMSASIDGAVVEQENRPFKNAALTEKFKNEEYYEKIIKFFLEHDWGFHPMIDASTIEKQKDNYVWWHEKLKEHNLTERKDWYNYLMFLEVRNDSWTDEKITAFLEWLNFALDYDYNELWTDNVIEFFTMILCSKRVYEIETIDGNKIMPSALPEGMVMSYMPSTVSNNETSSYGCSLGNLLVVRLGDLSIVPCHRTSYPKFNYGKFKVEDNKIVDIEAYNPFLMFNLVGQGSKTAFKCDACPLDKYCMHGCLGSQWEATKDLFFPIKSVCNMIMAKTIFMQMKAHAFKNSHDLDNQYKNLDLETKDLDNLIEKLKITNQEEVEKWQQIIAQQILI